jgi:ABC-2 type transport system ATP-binding protein
MCAGRDAARLEPKITVESLTRRYAGFTAVDNVSFTALPGRVTGFLGPNGAGKSTTMRVMVGLTVPTSGTATINGQRFADLPNPGLEVGVLLDASAPTPVTPDARSSRSPPTPPRRSLRSAGWHPPRADLRVKRPELPRQWRLHDAGRCGLSVPHVGAVQVG